MAVRSFPQKIGRVLIGCDQVCQFLPRQFLPPPVPIPSGDPISIFLYCIFVTNNPRGSALINPDVFDPATFDEIDTRFAQFVHGADVKISDYSLTLNNILHIYATHEHGSHPSFTAQSPDVTDNFARSLIRARRLHKIADFTRSIPLSVFVIGYMNHCLKSANLYHRHRQTWNTLNRFSCA